jgi:hypothetical protein
MRKVIHVLVKVEDWGKRTYLTGEELYWMCRVVEKWKKTQ